MKWYLCSVTFILPFSFNNADKSWEFFTGANLYNPWVREPTLEVGIPDRSTGRHNTCGMQWWHMWGNMYQPCVIHPEFEPKVNANWNCVRHSRSKNIIKNKQDKKDFLKWVAVLLLLLFLFLQFIEDNFFLWIKWKVFKRKTIYYSKVSTSNQKKICQAWLLLFSAQISKFNYQSLNIFWTIFWVIF